MVTVPARILARTLHHDSEQASLPVEEFIEALMGLVVHEEPLSTIETLALLRGLSRRMGTLEESCQEMRGAIGGLNDKMTRMQESIDNLAAAVSVGFRVRI